MKKQTIISAVFIAASWSVNAQWWGFTEPTALPGTVNSVGAEESMPVFSKDSSILYFVRTFDENNTGGTYDQDIWQSKRQSDGSYSELTRVKKLNNKFNNAAVGVSKDGSKMYLFNTYEGKKDVEKGIAVSEGNSGGWSKPSPLEIPGLDIDGDSYGFHVSGNGKVIIISYEGPGSLGKEDLYVSTKTGETWSSPKHMGATINSAGYEISPFLSPSGDTLFFSSNGMGGEGDADIFYAVKQGSWTSWSKPVNLGNKINSPKFDAYFSFAGDHAYWSSNRDGELSDIYMITFLNPPPIEVECVATNVSEFGAADGSIDLMIDGGDGPYSILWSNGASTEDIAGLAPGEYSATVTDKVGQEARATCSIIQPDKPLMVYENYQLKHFYGYNKNKLTTKNGELRDFVNSISKDLEAGRKLVTIKIYSSASQVPTKTFGTNEKLAQVRAENIKNDLEEFFKKSEGKVKVEIVSAVVAGPAYVEDSANLEKYKPYQFIELKTE